MPSPQAAIPHRGGRRLSSISLTATMLAALILAGCTGSPAGSSASSGSSSSGGPATSNGPATFWVAYSATSTGTGGQNGLFVIPSNSLAAAPSFVTSNELRMLAAADTVTMGDNAVTARSPAVMIYASAGADGNVHLYGVNLSDISAAPTPTQIGSLSVSALASICDFTQAQTDLTDPTTLFVLLHIAGPTGCNTSADLYQVAHYQDSPSTSPLTVAVTGFIPIYQSSGSLSGLLSLDAASNNLYLYANDTFTSPATVLTGVSAYNSLYDVTQIHHLLLGEDFLFLNVTVGTANSLYRVTGSGTASELYTAAGSLGDAVARDDANLYFMDSVSGTPPTVTFSQVTLSGVGTPMTLYRTSYADGSTYRLIGSNGSALVFDAASIDPTTAASTSTLMTLPVGQSSTSATSIGSAFAGDISVVMAAPTLDDPPADLLFVTVNNTSTSGGAMTYSYSSEVLTPDGTVKQALLPNSAFLERTSEFSGGIFQIKGITDTGGGYGGAGVYSVDLGTLAATAFATTGGATYTVPAGYMSGFFGVSNGIGVGALSNTGSSAALQVTAYDLTQQLMLSASLANTDIRPASPAPQPASGPLFVHVAPDMTRATQQALTASTGGTLTATGADGTSYVLTIPPGALPADTTVSLIPLAAVSGLPLGGALNNGVQFAPEGLILNTPATLTIHPATPVPLAQLIGFGYRALGEQFHLEPTGGDDTAIVMAVRHFSGAGTSTGTATQAEQFAQQSTPSYQVDNFSQEAMLLLLEYRNGQIDKETFDSEVGLLVTTFYEGIIKPQLIAGLDSDEAFTSGAQAALSFLRQMEINGFAPDQIAIIGPEIQGLIKQGFLNELDRAALLCANNQDYNQLDRMVSAERQGQLLGYLPEESIDFSKFTGCIIFAAVPYPNSATVNVNGTQPFWLHLYNQQNQILINADRAIFSWTSGDASIASVSAAGNQQGIATGLQEGSTSIVPLAATAYDATTLGLGTTQYGAATLTVVKKADCAAYLSVKNWSVNVVTSFSQKATGSPSGSGDNETITATINHNLNYTFSISGGSTPVWQGPATGGSANVADTSVTTILGPLTTTDTTTATGSVIGGGTALSVFTLTIDPVACTYGFSAGLFGEVTFTHDPPQPPFTTSFFGDGVRRAGDTLSAVAAGAVPTITGGAALPAYNITSPLLGSDPNLNAYVPQLGEAPILSEILGDPLGSTATVSWTITATP